MQKILFATRFGDMAFNSLETLFVLKKAGLRLIVLCHIIPREEVGFVPFGGYLKKEADELKEQARIRFEDWQRAIAKAGIAAEPHLLAGKPEEELIAEARAAGCSMIIAATSDREPPENAPLGSMARKLCETSEFPLLLVPVTPLSYPEDLD